MPSDFMEIIPQCQRQVGCIPFAFVRWHVCYGAHVAGIRGELLGAKGVGELPTLTGAYALNLRLG